MRNTRIPCKNEIIVVGFVEDPSFCGIPSGNSLGDRVGIGQILELMVLDINNLNSGRAESSGF